MNLTFYLAALLALASTVMVITRKQPVPALMFMVVSLLAAATMFFTLGAPFVAALEILIYAGAIMVLFVFVVMMLNLGRETIAQEESWLQPKIWILPVVFALSLLGIVAWQIQMNHASIMLSGVEITPKQVGIQLYGEYLLAVEFASILLTAGLIGAYHLGRRQTN